MKNTKFNEIIKTIKAGAVKHTPEILTGIGIAGLITTPVLAVIATPKALKLMDIAMNEKEDDLTPIEVVKVTWKCYIPALLTGASSIACIIGANSVHASRNAALATAYNISRTALVDYREKVVETLGEKKEKEVREKVAADKMDSTPIKNNEVIIMDKGNSMCYDSVSGRYFMSSVDTINKAVNHLNRQMLSEMYISLTEFYYEIGLESTKVSDNLGWNLDMGEIEVVFGSKLADDGTPCLSIDYLVEPRYDFSKLM